MFKVVHIKSHCLQTYKLHHVILKRFFKGINLLKLNFFVYISAYLNIAVLKTLWITVMLVPIYEGQSICNASYFFLLYFSRKLKYNYIALKLQH